MRPKPIRLLSRIAMMLFMMLLTTTTVWADNVAVTSVSDFGTMTEGTTTESGYYTLTSGNTYTLQNDVNIHGYLSIPSGTTVIIDLNGHTLDRGLNQSSAIGSGYVLNVKGILTLNDSQSGGIVTGGCTTGIGAGVFVYGSDALFTMNGGCITGNKQSSSKTKSGGGVSVRSNGTFIMNGGSITNNVTTHNGGGVFVETATFTMNGGTISGNKCPSGYDGAGVYVYHSTSNDNHATFNVSGSAIVTGNTKGTSTTDNVYLCKNTIINVTGALTTSANIGVRMADKTDFFAQGSDYTLTASDAGHFSSDVSGFYSMFDSGTGKLKFVDKDPALLSVLTWNKTGKYFEIQDEQDLIDLGYYTNDGNTCEGLTFKMTADLDFSSHTADDCRDILGAGNFMPIGGNAWFKGTFDGQNHSITGLRFRTNHSEYGLFSSVESPAIIQNVRLVCPQLTGDQSYGGCIVGTALGCTVNNCTVVDGIISGDDRIGGIIGLANVKNKSVTISGCTVVNTSVSGSAGYGIIVGHRGSESNSLIISDCTYHNPDGLAVCGQNGYYDGGGNKQVYQARLTDGLTASNASYSHGNDYYFTKNATVTLGNNRPGYVCGYQSSDVTITNGAFTMPASDVTVTATWYDLAPFGYNEDPQVDGSAAHPYVISTAAGWGAFCDALQDNETWNRFSGKTVKLGDDISVTRMAGSDGHDFCGTFDGQGKTLIVSYENTDNNDMTAPFSYVDAATIQNLKVSGSITGSAHRAAGIIGETSDNLSHITNCMSSVNISGGRYTAGFSIGGNVAIEGCVFNGIINGSSRSGGFVGWSYSGLAITNCLFAPQDGSSISGGTFYYNGGGGAPTPTNSYYTTALGTAQGTAVFAYTSEPAGIGVEGTTYDVSGITAYESGIKYGTEYYTAPPSTLNLTAHAYDGNNWTTFYCGNAGYKIDNNENACAYTATYSENDKKEGIMTMHKLGKVIPKNTAVIIVGENENIGMTASTDAAQYTVSNNLYGVDVRTKKSTLGTGTFYVLSQKGDDFGFFEYTGEYMPARKAYLLVNGSEVLARGITMVFDEEMGIRPTPGPSLNGGEWYDLSGRKLDGKPTKKGLYINNGKKVVIK